MGNSKEMYVFYSCKVGQPDAQHNGMTNSETEICMCK